MPLGPLSGSHFEPNAMACFLLRLVMTFDDEMPSMTSIWQSKPITPEREFEAMATVLEARHGLHAAEIAEFFAYLHIDKGDERRSSAWADVAELVRERERARLHE